MSNKNEAYEPAAPDASEKPAAPDAPQMPAAPDAPQMPVAPDVPKISAAPDIPKMPAAEAQAMQPTPIAQLPPEQKLAMAKHLRSEINKLVCLYCFQFDCRYIEPGHKQSLPHY